VLNLRIAIAAISSAIVLSGQIISTQTSDSEAARRQIYLDGESALKAGRLDEAESKFLKVAAMQPKDLGAHVNLGVIYMRQKNWDRALEEFGKAEKLAPQIPGIRFDIGLVHYREGQYHEAIAPFESVLRDKSDWTQARHLLGLCYIHDERFADAAAALEPLWTSSSSDLSYLYALAVAAGNADRRDLEDRALRRMAEVDQTPQLHFMIGKAYLSRGRDEEALAEIQKAAQTDPKLPMLHYTLGIIYKRGRDYEKARQEFLADIRAEPEVANSYEELGNICVGLEQNEEARRYFEQALQRNSRLPASWYGLAKIDRAGKRYLDALKDLDSAGALDPKSASIHYLRAQVLTQLGRKAEAETEFATVRRLHQETIDRLEQQISAEKYRDPQLGAEQK